MIVAAGLTPAWQQIMRFEGFRAGEVNRAVDVAWCASGKVLNVGIALKQLGAPSETIALLGGATGEQIERAFESLAAHASWVKSRVPTRVCTTILDVPSGRATELVENAAPVTPAELDEFHRVYAERVSNAQLAILTGSLPAGARSTLFSELLCDTPCPALLDIRGPELIAALEHRVLLVKPNREELARTAGRKLDTDARLQSAMLELNERGAQWVVISDGSHPVFVSSNGKCFRITPPRVAVVNPIGSGDCLAAAVAWAITEGADPLDALRLGVAAAATNAGQLLPARLDPDAVRELAETIVVERIE